MSRWRSITIERLVATLLGVLAATTVVLGAVGYSSYYSDLSAADAVYYGVGLLALTFYSSPEESAQVPQLLNAARFLGVFVAFGAVLATLLAVVGDRAALWYSRRLKNHTVVVGATNLAVEIAVAHKRADKRPVVLIGELDAWGAAELRRHGVRQIDGLSGTDLERMVADAALAVVATASDADALNVASSLLDFTKPPGRIQVMIEDSTLAHRLTWTAFGGIPGVTVACLAERVACEVLRTSPPTRPDELNAPPIVIGTGEEAAAFVRAMVTGWHVPGEPLTIWAFGPDVEGWAGKVKREIAGWGTVEVCRDLWSPAFVQDQVTAAMATWAPKLGPSQVRRDPLVVVAGLDDAEAYVVAGELVGLHLDRPPVIVAGDTGNWEKLVAIPPGSVTKVFTGQLLTGSMLLDATPLDLLARELEVYEEQWPDDLAPLMGGRDRPSCAQVAAGVPDALAAANLHVRAGVSRMVLLPEEAAAMADALLPVFGARADLEVGSELRQRVFDLVSMLPLMLARTGQRLDREDEPAVVLDDAAMEAMARRAHFGYQQHDAASGQATQSTTAAQEWEALTEWHREQNLSQVRDLPVKLALVGLTLAPAGAGDETAWAQVDDDTLEQLAIHEHRRWEYLHRLAGWTYGKPTDHASRVHSCLVPWGELKDDVRQYDRDAVANIPAIVRAGGFSLVRFPPA